MKGRRKPFMDLRQLVEEAEVADEPLPGKVVYRGETIDLGGLIPIWAAAPQPGASPKPG